MNITKVGNIYIIDNSTFFQSSEKNLCTEIFHLSLCLLICLFNYNKINFFISLKAVFGGERGSLNSYYDMLK
jgi:hypothetical protein